MVYDGLCMDKVENRGPKSESVERHFPNHVGKKVKRERESAQVQRRLRTQDSLFASGTTPRGAHGLKLETQELAQEATGEDRTCCQRALHLPSPII